MTATMKEWQVAMACIEDDYNKGVITFKQLMKERTYMWAGRRQILKAQKEVKA